MTETTHFHITYRVKGASRNRTAYIGDDPAVKHEVLCELTARQDIETISVTTSVTKVYLPSEFSIDKD
jgi:hypothetical protein